MKNNQDNQNDQPEKLEELERSIDRAVVSYIDAEPSPGLEYRVLEIVRQTAQRKSRLWWWAVATPLLAAALLIVLLHFVYRPAVPSSHIAQSSPAQGATSRTVSENSGAPSLRSKGGKSDRPTTKGGSSALRSKSGARESIAEKSSFHGKGWLTATPPQSAAAATSDLVLHDASLVALVRERPDQLRALFAKTDPEPIAPVRIYEIEIKPITADETDELR